MSGITALLGPPEFFERFQGKFFGKFRALVKLNNDPLGKYRVRVICETIYGPDLSPWCSPCFPFGYTGVIPINTLVWLEFEEGVVEYPIVVGVFAEHARRGQAQDGSPLEASRNFQEETTTAPLHTQGKPDGTDFDGTSKGTPGVPETNFKGTYGKVQMWRSEAGQFIELDDTLSAERIQIMHATGAYIEFLPDGSISKVAEGIAIEKSRGERVRIDGESRHDVSGSRTLDIKGDFIINVGGAYRVNCNGEASFASERPSVTVNGDDEKFINGSWKRTTQNNFSIQAGGDGDIGTFGNFNLQVGGFGSIIFSNAQNIPNPLAETLNITGQQGKVTLRATDLTGLAAQFGIEIMPLGTVPPFTPVPVPASTGPHIFVGNLAIPRGPTGVPLVQENIVLGTSLVAYLNGLHTLLQAWLFDYLTHTHPWFSPPVSAVAQAAILPAQLTALQATFLAPGPPKLNPLILSDIFYTSKG